MRAIAYSRFGGPDVLETADLPDPKVAPDSVVVRVRATSVNPVDWKIREGYLDGLLDTVFPVVPGWDVAGVQVARTFPLEETAAAHTLSATGHVQGKVVIRVS